MKRFFNDEPDEFFDKADEADEEMEELTDEEIKAMQGDFVGYIDEEALVALIHEHLDENASKDNLLIMAVQVAEKRFFWRFYSMTTQLKIIRQIYEGLTEIQLST